MEELNIKRNQGRKEQLKYAIIIILIFSGMLFDLFCYIAEQLLYETDQWFYLHNTLREFKLLGFSLLAFSEIQYDQIKLKTLSFSFCVWSSVIIVYNACLPSASSVFFTAPIFLIYLWWLIRTATLKKENINLDEQYKLIEQYSQNNTGVPYNILMPVKTFRGLLQILFIPWRNPLYETRILVGAGKIIYVNKKTFKEIPYSEPYVISLLKNGGKIRACKNCGISKVKSIIGKRLILGFRDCKVLEL